MKHLFFIFLSFLVSTCLLAQPGEKDISLNTCFSLAHGNNYLVLQAQHSLEARRYTLTAERLGMLPKVDLLAGYNYLSNPLTINLETVRNGVIEGSSQQSVYAANEIYRQITGQNLPAPVLAEIYSTSQNIIGTAYPDYNPELSQQQYFTAGLFIRQPIWLGGKMSTARKVASTGVNQGLINQQVIQNELDFSIAIQYIRIQYLNRLIALEQQSVEDFEENASFVSELVKNEIVPPYLQSWTKVLLVQARNRHSSSILDRQNAMTALKRLLGVPSDTVLPLIARLDFQPATLSPPDQGSPSLNPVLALAGSNTSLAQINIRGAQSMLMPNLFGIANINLYQKDLPVTTPPWMVGIELQWSLFDGFANVKRVQASKQLAAEAALQEKNTRDGLQSNTVIALNKVVSLRQDIATIDSARVESRYTSSLVRERAKSNFCSPKEINDALLIQQEIEISYYTAVFAYYMALAEYCNFKGTASQVADFMMK